METSLKSVRKLFFEDHKKESARIATKYKKIKERGIQLKNTILFLPNQERLNELLPKTEFLTSRFLIDFFPDFDPSTATLDQIIEVKQQTEEIILNILIPKQGQQGRFAEEDQSLIKAEFREVITRYFFEVLGFIFSQTNNLISAEDQNKESHLAQFHNLLSQNVDRVTKLVKERIISDASESVGANLSVESKDGLEPQPSPITLTLKELQVNDLEAIVQLGEILGTLIETLQNHCKYISIEEFLSGIKDKLGADEPIRTAIFLEDSIDYLVSCNSKTLPGNRQRVGLLKRFGYQALAMDYSEVNAKRALYVALNPRITSLENELTKLTHEYNKSEALDKQSKDLVTKVGTTSAILLLLGGIFIYGANKPRPTKVQEKLNNIAQETYDTGRFANLSDASDDTKYYAHILTYYNKFSPHLQEAIDLLPIGQDLFDDFSKDGMEKEVQVTIFFKELFTKRPDLNTELGHKKIIEALIKFDSAQYIYRMSNLETTNLKFISKNVTVELNLKNPIDELSVDELLKIVDLQEQGVNLAEATRKTVIEIKTRNYKTVSDKFVDWDLSTLTLEKLKEYFGDAIKDNTPEGVESNSDFSSLDPKQEAIDLLSRIREELEEEYKTAINNSDTDKAEKLKNEKFKIDLKLHQLGVEVQ